MYRPVGHKRFAPRTVAALAASVLALSVVPGVADADDSDDAKNLISAISTRLGSELDDNADDVNEGEGDDIDDDKNDVAQDQGKQEEGSSQGAKIAAGVAGGLALVLALIAGAYQAGLLPNIPGLPKFF